MSAARLAFVLTLLLASTAQAQQRRVEIRFTPTARAQLAIWVESADGERFETVRLTQSVSFYGIGNRPGALLMNSGFRWPFGRREGVLPVWAHRRFEAQGTAFPRVVFNGRRSEGNASSAGSVGEPRNTRDDYFCLSFQRERSGRDALDAVSCASIFMSNKGRYMTAQDVDLGYAEPYEDASGAMMRPLSLTSLYPPRRDVAGCETGCGDHESVRRYAADARAVMPDIDAVTMATPAGDAEQRIVWDVPDDWPEGDYVVYVEVNVEGDYNDFYNDELYPTPTEPSGMWDYWAINYGYAYRGQPSVLFEVPVSLVSTGASVDVATPAGYGALHGEDGELRTMDETILDDALAAPGSGADRLRRGSAGMRVSVTVPMWDICNQPDPPEECGWECEPGDGRCGSDLVCGPDYSCVGVCDVPMTPPPVEQLEVLPHDDESHSHEWARFSFVVPEVPRGVMRYEVRVGTEPIVDDASFSRALPALEPAIDTIELRVPSSTPAGERVELVLGGLTPQQQYFVGVRTYDACNASSEVVSAEVETTAIHFTTVSPCFVATAAYGTPLASEVGALRRFRDRHLRTNAPGRALVDAYYALGPHLARAIEDDEELRAAARTILTPIVDLVTWLD